MPLQSIQGSGKMSVYLSNRFSGITPYTPGEQPRVDGLVKLNTNESPFPPSPKVIEIIDKNRVSHLNLYSDPDCSDLIKAISEIINCAPDCIIPGNGSDEILAFAFQAFCDIANQPVFADLTYGFYPVFCELYGLTPTIIPLREDLSINAADYSGINRPIFIANPNAPTGLCLSLSEIERIVESNNSIVLVDEAYVDFGGETAVGLISKHENLIVSRTFSKSRNLAGARLGFAVACPELIADLNKIKFSFNPYNINSLTAFAGTAAIRDVEYFEGCVNNIINNRVYTVKELEKRGFIVPDSKANFIFPRHNEMSGETYFRELRKRNILVRYFPKDRIKNHVRITIGSMDQMKKLIEATDDILGR